MARLGLSLPPPAEPAGNYVPWRMAGNMLFLSAVGPRLPNGAEAVGKVGQALTVQQGQDAAKLCALALIGNMRGALGHLDRVETILSVNGMLNTAPNFIEHGRVMDGCTDVFVQVFGNNGRPTRSVIGTGSTQRGLAMEIDAIVLFR